MRIRIEKAVDADDRCIGWNLFVDNQWHETYPTRKAAREAGKTLKGKGI